MGGEELKWRQLAHHQLMSLQGLILVHTVQLKPMIKAQISGKLVTNDTSGVAIASVHSEKTRLKKMIMIIIMKESTIFGGRLKLTSAMKQRPEN